MADGAFLVVTANVDHLQRSGPLSSGNAQAWRKALEDASWRDALGAVRPFGSRQDFSGDVDESGRSQEKPKMSSPSFPLIEAVVEQTKLVLPGSSMMTNSPPSIPRSLPLKPLDLRLGISGALLPQRPMAGRSSAPHPESSATGHSQWPGMRCPARNVTTTRQADGIAVWIRDSLATSAQVAALLAPLKKTMGEVGAQVLRVSLNGSPVWSAVSVRPSVPQVKE